MLGDIKYQPIIITVPSSGAQVTVEADTDKLYERCTGIYVSLPSDEMFSSYFSRFELGGKELFPDRYEVKMLTGSEHVPCDELYYQVNECAKGARLKTAYNDSGLSSSYPYTAVLYLRLQNK